MKNLAHTLALLALTLTTVTAIEVHGDDSKHEDVDEHWMHLDYENHKDHHPPDKTAMHEMLSTEALPEGVTRGEQDEGVVKKFHLGTGAGTFIWEHLNVYCIFSWRVSKNPQLATMEMHIFSDPHYDPGVVCQVSRADRGATHSKKTHFLSASIHFGYHMGPELQGMPEVIVADHEFLTPDGALLLNDEYEVDHEQGIETTASWQGDLVMAQASAEIHWSDHSKGLDDDSVRIVPDVFHNINDFPFYQEMMVLVDDTEDQFGAEGIEMCNVIKPQQAHRPPIVHWAGEQAGLYTIAMVDPDAPSRKDRSEGQVLHWLVQNIPTHNIHSGDHSARYVPPIPREGTGKHRYTIILFFHKSEVKAIEPLADNTLEGRMNWNISEWATARKMRPVSVKCFEAEYDPSVDTVLSHIDEGRLHPAHHPSKDLRLRDHGEHAADMEEQGHKETESEHSDDEHQDLEAQYHDKMESHVDETLKQAHNID